MWDLIKLIGVVFLISLTGCVSVQRTDMLLDKSTVLGVDIAEPTGHARIKIGLIRNFYQRIPTSTNQIYTPNYSTHVNSTLGFTSQTVEESYSVGNTNILK